MKAKTDLTAGLLNELFEVKDSKLIWKVKRNGTKGVGSEAGTINTWGYLQVRINGKTYKAHRLLYMLYHNMEILAELQIDHIDGDRLNNSIDNLRLVTHQENCFNRTRAKGYCWDKQKKKFKAQIAINGKYKHLGHYDTEEDARIAYLQAKEQLHTIEVKGVL